MHYGIRDLLWLSAVVALACAYWIKCQEHSRSPRFIVVPRVRYCGLVNPSTTYDCSFEIKNTSSKILQLSVGPMSDTLSCTDHKLVIQPGEKKTLVIQWNSNPQGAAYVGKITVYTNDSVQPTIDLAIIGNVRDN